MNKEYNVIIDNWAASYVKSENTRAVYWLWKDKEKLPKKYLEQLSTFPLIQGKKAYCSDNLGNKFLKNTKKVGTTNLWVLNGQDLYNAALNWRLRKTIAKFYHSYFSEYIKKQILNPIEIPEGKFLSISCDIYEIRRGNMPDVSNMWLLEKFFEDALQECGIIPGDDPNYVRESGRKRYYFVDSEAERKLIFKINVIS